MTTVKIDYICKVESGEWRHYKWQVRIGDELFEYRTGLGLVDKKKTQTWGVPTPKKPTADEVLHCLFLDARCGEYSFDEFCDNLGYSNDSLKALDAYRACVETGKKLYRALKGEYRSEKARIEALESKP